MANAANALRPSNTLQVTGDLSRRKLVLGSSAPAVEFWRSGSGGFPAVTMMYPGNRRFFTLRFLMLVADGGDRLQVRRRPSGQYDSAEWYGGVRYESILPASQHIQGFPAALASFEPWSRRVWAGLARPLLKIGGGGWSGAFDFPVGTQFVVRVSYRAVWRRWRLSELDVCIDGGEPVGAIARAEWDLFCIC